MSDKISYDKAGVHTAATDEALDKFLAFQRSRKKVPELLSGIGPFAACFSLKNALHGVEDPVLVTCCDGVGTKVKLAVEWNKVDGLGQDLVAMNVNDLLCVGASPLVFLDYFGTSRLDEPQYQAVLESIQIACEESGCALVGGETAEMPGFYPDRLFDLAGFCAGIADRGKLFTPDRIREGMALVGFASSGVHSNGYSLVRKLVEREGLSPESKPSFSKATWKELLLAPTLLYPKYFRREDFGKIAGLAHITGGGVTENLPRVLPDHLAAELSKKDWPVSPLFQWLQQKAALSDEEMATTFNNGIGLVAVVPEEHVEALTRKTSSQGLPSYVLGKVTQRKTAGVVWV